MRRVVVDMGIASPVTRDVARGGFERELCKEIAVFLMGKPGEQGLLSQFGGMVPMTDVWYYLNRARSAELVAPDEVVAACSLFEEVVSGRVGWYAACSRRR